jgi:hypothetical protein
VTTAPAFIVLLREKLEDRYATVVGMEGVRVYVVQPTDVNIDKDTVVLIRDRVPGTQEYAASGRRRRDDAYRIPGFVSAYAVHQNASTAFVQAWERAAALIGEIEKTLRDDPPLVGDTLKGAVLAEIAFQPAVLDTGGWVCRGEFTVAYEARVT